MAQLKEFWRRFGPLVLLIGMFVAILIFIAELRKDDIEVDMPDSTEANFREGNIDTSGFDGPERSDSADAHND